MLTMLHTGTSNWTSGHDALEALASNPPFPHTTTIWSQDDRAGPGSAGH